MDNEQEKNFRIEKDFLGEVLVPRESLYGIHSLRAKDNFISERKMSYEWYKAIGEVKQSFYQTYQNYKRDLLKKITREKIKLVLMEDEIILALEKAGHEVATGQHFDFFIVAGDCGGAGTSLNMNVNEIIANRSLEIIGKEKGDYSIIDPIEQCNVFQSTNDVIPTALRIAMMRLLNQLENSVSDLREEIEIKEKEGKDQLRMGYTEMQLAVPSSFGKLFSTYQEALSRDWWRISKCRERIKEVNIGGGAIGTGLSVPRYFIKKVIENLRLNTKLNLSRSPNLVEATCNMDSIVEVHSILKTLAVNLEKMSCDLRLLSADFFSSKPLSLAPLQVGSSIMPSKVNPVITEFAVGKIQQIYGHNQVICSLAGQGVLELNSYLSQIGTLVLEDLKSLINLVDLIKEKMVKRLTFNFEEAKKDIFLCPTIVTALIPLIGYQQAKRIADLMRIKKIDIFSANQHLKLVDEKLLMKLMAPSELLKLGYSLLDLIKMEENQ